MTPKQRLLSTLRGEETDRPAWSPFLAYWWEANENIHRQRDQLAYLTDIGTDPLLRGFEVCWDVHRDNVEFETSTRGSFREETFRTPVGELKLGYRLSEIGNTWFLCDHPVKTAEDLKILSYIYEHTRVTPKKDADTSYKNIGERGLMLPLVGVECKTCFQSLVEHWIGSVDLAYLVEDEPQEIESCLEAMRRVSQETAVIDAQTPYEAFIFWEDSSTTNISPSMFRRFTMPEIEAWGNTLHAAGKMLIHHACGHLRDLLPLMAELPIDAVESISPPPTGNIDIPEAFALLPPHVALVGGIEPVFYENCTLPELNARVDHLMRATKGRRFLLANSDSCPPKVTEEKFRFVSAKIKEMRL